jgi:hypothetical protein
MLKYIKKKKKKQSMLNLFGDPSQLTSSKIWGKKKKINKNKNPLFLVDSLLLFNDKDCETKLEFIYVKYVDG